MEKIKHFWKNGRLATPPIEYAANEVPPVIAGPILGGFQGVVASTVRNKSTGSTSFPFTSFFSPLDWIPFPPRPQHLTAGAISSGWLRFMQPQRPPILGRFPYWFLYPAYGRLP